MNNAQNTYSFNSKVDLVDQTSSPNIFKRTNTIDREAKTTMSQELVEMKEMQYKGSWKTVEKKRKLQHQSRQERQGARQLKTKKIIGPIDQFGLSGC